MKYDELVKLWKTQRDEYQQWELSLLKSSAILRDHIETLLSPPSEKWKDYTTHVPHRYVELVDFYNHSNPERRSPRPEAITSDGVLVFGIGVTFDHGLETYPKQDLYVPVAARYNQHKVEYSFFNRDHDSAETSWTTDLDEFCGKIIKRYKDYLSHDPYTGFGNKTRMGFL